MPMDWVMGLAGGLVIGTAAAIYLLVNGRIMGASGIVGDIVDGSARSDWRERGVFVAGLILIPGAVALWRGLETGLTPNLALIIVAGLAVGLGTRLANGCTSGHGVCGISRLSPRGIVASAMYVGAGIATVTLMGALG